MASTTAATTDTAGQHDVNGHDTFNGQGPVSSDFDNHHGDTRGIMPPNKPHQSTMSQVYQPTLGRIGNPGPLGLVAGIIEYVVGNTFGATLHCSYGAFWLAFAMFLVPSLGIQAAYNGDTRAYSFAPGIFLILWCFLTLVFFVAALRTNLAVLVVLGFLALAFLFLGIAQFISTTHLTAAVRVNRAGGAFAVICAFAAFYAGSAGLMTEATTPVRFPLGEFNYAPRTRTANTSQV